MKVIKIKNWDKYNKRKDLKTMSWFAVSSDISRDEAMFDFSPAQKWFWIFLLAESAKNDGAIKLNEKFLAHHSGLSKDEVIEAVGSLKNSKLIEIIDIETSQNESVRNTNECVQITNESVPYKTDMTRQTEHNNTEHNNTFTEKVFSGEIVELKQPKKKKTEPDELEDFRFCRDAYVSSFESRYGVKPTWSAKQNSMLKKLMASVGKQEALWLCERYIDYNDPYHVRNKHPLGLLLGQVDQVRVDLRDPRRMLDHRIASSEINAEVNNHRNISRIEKIVKDEEMYVLQ